MYMGEPQRVAAITPSCKKRAKPKSAIFIVIEDGGGWWMPEPVGDREEKGGKMKKKR